MNIHYILSEIVKLCKINFQQQQFMKDILLNLINGSMLMCIINKEN